MTTKNVPSKNAKTAVVTADYEARLVELARKGVQQEANVGGGQFISFQSGQISFQGNTVRGNELDVIAIDSVFENQYNPAKFDPDDPQPPVCYAFGRTEEDLKPHPECAEPQAEACKGCPRNEFGTADNGKGKACRNARRIAVLPGDTLTEEVLKSADAAFLRLPVTSVKGWAAFVKTVAAIEKLPTFGVVATLATVPDAKTQFKVTWKTKERIDRELLPVLLSRHDAIAESIMFPYAQPSEEPKKVSPKGKGGKARNSKY